jgi:hypothetical protein
MNPGRVIARRNSRIIGNMHVGSGVDRLPRSDGDAPTNVVSMDYRSNGEVPIRASGDIFSLKLPWALEPSGVRFRASS